MTLEHEQLKLEETTKKEARSQVSSSPPPFHHMSLNCFLPEMLRGQKVATTRAARPIKKGDRLSLYWEKQTDIWHKPIHWICDAVVIEVRPWTLPPKESQDWLDIYHHTLLRDCWWPDTESPDNPPSGWTPVEAWDKLRGWYGEEAELVTIWYEPDLSHITPREILLTLRLHELQEAIRAQRQRTQVEHKESKVKDFLAPSARGRGH